jgi:hypothetical protein
MLKTVRGYDDQNPDTQDQKIPGERIEAELEAEEAWPAHGIQALGAVGQIEVIE